MNKRLFIVLLFFSVQLISQNTLKGIVVDSKTNETLIGANIVLNSEDNSMNSGTASDFNGEFMFDNLNKNNYQLTISYIGYETKTISIAFSTQKIIEEKIKLVSDITLDVVTLVSDQAEFRKTPVSLSNVKIEQIEKELAGQEIPMLLNSTPGVYATQQGGGDGDVNINIRGFSQRNVAVMIDGVPMNDMENGWVYWSNWFGLDGMTRTIQVQRGLGASKLALPSVGGTINIITKGIDAKEGGMLKQSVGSGGSLKTEFAYTTKMFRLGKFNVAGALKKSNGLVEATSSRGLFYYLKWQKEFNQHFLSLTAFGAPQEHDQRKYSTDIAIYDKDYAANLGIDTAGLEGDYGFTHNPHWGEYNEYEVIFENGMPVDTIFGEDKIGIKYKNYYHKPNFNLHHLWQINDSTSLTNVIYYSNGNGGGTTWQGGDWGEGEALTDDGQVNFQYIYDLNTGNRLTPMGPFMLDFSIIPEISETEHKSGNILVAGINKHSWLGMLSTFNHRLNNEFDFAGGLDFRTYKGVHYREVYDLLGGDYFLGSDQPSGIYIGASNDNKILREGDKLYYHNDGLVRWLGGFGQLEYEHKNITAFLNLTGSHSFYKRIDYFKKKDLVLSDTILVQAIGINDTICNYGSQISTTCRNPNHNHYTSDSKEARFAETDWQTFPGFSVKTGANWNIDENHNVFFNTGILSKAPRFANVFDYDNNLIGDPQNEVVKGLEIGYGYRSSIFALNFNAYNTVWENKPQTGAYPLESGTVATYNITGLGALHRGLEVDFAWKISSEFKYEFLSSIGDWKWTDPGIISIYEDQQLKEQREFDAEGLQVGDSPQTQIGSSVSYNYKINKALNGYVKLKGIYFDRFYSDYSPGTEGNVDSNGKKKVWKIPGYKLFSFHVGNALYFENSSLHFRLNILNLFNTLYINDADNNSDYLVNKQYEYDEDGAAIEVRNSDAASAAAFFGLGRRMNVSLQYKF